MLPCSNWTNLRSLTLGIVSILFCFSAELRASDQPNILFFLVDDMGTTDTSVRFLKDADGELIDAPLNSRYRTPAMEQLSDQGLRFTNAYACTVCTPTRVSILTGKEATRLHITTWTHPQRSVDTGKVAEGGLVGPDWRLEGVDPKVDTLPRLLSDAGYTTILAGKAHFGPNDTPAGDPKNVGFDINIAGHGAGGIGSHLGKHRFSAAWRGGGRDWDVPGLDKYRGQDIYLTEALTLEMKQAISESVDADRPFFAYMSHYAVHAPFEIDERFQENYPDLEGKALAFATMVEGMDKSLGDLLRHLEQLGVAEQTLVVFYSDNGSDGPPNLPLRGIKGSRFLGGNRVPLIVAWAKPNSNHPLQQRLPIPMGGIEDDLVAPVDFLPTLTRLAQISLPEDIELDGHNLLPYFAGTPGTHRPQNLLIHFPHGRHRSHLFSSWTDGDWKITYEYAKRAWHLHNLRTDLSEVDNLLQKHPDRARSLARRMVAELEERGALFPLDESSGDEVRPDLTLLDDEPA